MNGCDQQGRAPVYALGLLDDDDSIVFEHHMVSCPECAEVVRQSAEIAVSLARALPTVAPPSTLRDNVLNGASSPRSREMPRGVAALVRATQLNWQATSFAGVLIARLYEDPIGGDIASLVRMAPGSCYPAHSHASLEHCYVLEGDLAFEDHTLTAGDYSAGSPGGHHSASMTTGGCLLFVIHNTRDQVQTSDFGR
jgi:anti-sigma factor ChrR (cupin superfamily)